MTVRCMLSASWYVAYHYRHIVTPARVRSCAQKHADTVFRIRCLIAHQNTSDLILRDHICQTIAAKELTFSRLFLLLFASTSAPVLHRITGGGSKKHKGSKNRRISYWLMVNYRGRPSLSDRLPVTRKTLSPARGFLQRICISLHVTVFEISDICLWNLIFLEYFTLRIQIKSEFILLRAKT